MYTTATKRPLGANWDTREYIHVHTNSCAWLKYVAVAVFVVALRFLCCA